MVCGPLRNGLAKPQSHVPRSRWPMIYKYIPWCGQTGKETLLQESPAWAGQTGHWCQIKNSHARFFPEQLWSFFPPTWTNLDKSILYYSSAAASALGKKHSCPFKKSLRSGGNVDFSVSNNPRSKKEKRNAGLGIHVTNEWAKLMSCSKCENFCVESMPRAVCHLLNVSLQTERIYGAGKPWCFYARWRALSNERASCISWSLSLFRFFRVN